MITWECEDCGYEIELPEGTNPTVCPGCGGTGFRIKPPAPPGGAKIRP